MIVFSCYSDHDDDDNDEGDEDDDGADTLSPMPCPFSCHQVPAPSLLVHLPQGSVIRRTFIPSH